MYQSPSISSQYQFASPLKRYGFPTQSSTIQTSNAGNLDEQAKQIAFQYQYPPYNFPGQRDPYQNTSSTSVLQTGLLNKPFNIQNQAVPSTTNSLKGSTYIQQPISQSISPNLVKNDNQYGMITAQKNNYFDHSPYQFKISSDQQNVLSNVNTPYKQKQQQQFTYGISQSTEQMAVINRDNARIKVDEIINQVKKNMPYSQQGGDSGIKQSYLGEQPSTVVSSINIGNTESRFPLQTSSLSSEYYKIESQQGIQFQKSDPIIQSQIPVYISYDQSKKIDSGNLSGQTSTIPPINQMFNNYNNNDQKPSFNTSYFPIENQDKNKNININSSYTSPVQLSIGGVSATKHQQNSINENKQELSKDKQLQNNHSQFQYTTPITHHYAKNPQLNNNNSSNISNFILSYGGQIPSSSHYENPISSNFDKGTINDILSAGSPGSSNFYAQQQNFPINQLEQKNSNRSDFQSDKQSVQLQFSQSTIQSKDQISQNMKNIQDKQQYLGQEQLKQQMLNDSQKNISQDDLVVTQINFDQQNNQRSPQKYINHQQVKQDVDNKSFHISPNKVSPLEEENVNNWPSGKRDLTKQFQQVSNNKEKIIQISPKDNTFETIQNETQNYEFKDEGVKRSKQQKSPTKQMISPNLKNSQSHNSSQKEKSQYLYPRSNSSNIIEQNVEDIINKEDFFELNKWFDPDFQIFIKKNFSKQQKKMLIEQLSKQIQSDSDDGDEVEESKNKKKQFAKQQKNDFKKKSQSSHTRSPQGSLNTANSNKQDQIKQTFNLYERIQQRKQILQASPQKDVQNQNHLQELANKFSQIKEIKNEDEQIEYIQFSNRCKAELERQQNLKKKKKQNQGNNQLEVESQNYNTDNSQKFSMNQFKSIQSIESENVVMTKESKLLLQEIYNEVQNALKKYDYIIQENQKNRKNSQQNKKEMNPDNVSSDNLNIITTNSLKTNNSQQRFESSNQETSDQYQNFRKSQGQSIPKQNNSQTGKNTPTKRSKQQMQSNGKKIPSLNFQSDSPGTSSVISPVYNRESTNNIPINKQQKQFYGNMSEIDGNQIIRISKMEENEAENVFNNRRQQILKALQNTTKQRKNSTQIQQRPMNHSQTRASHNVSHIRTPSNSMSQRNSQIFQNQPNEYDLNSSITSGNKYKAGTLLNKFLSPKNNSNRHPSSKDLETPTQSLKSSQFAGRIENQKAQQHFEKNSYQLTDQPSKQEFDKNIQVLEPETKIKQNQNLLNENAVSNVIGDTIHLENVKRSGKQRDENKQIARKKSILNNNQKDMDIYQINLGNKDEKKKQIRERKERVQQIYDKAQKSMNDIGESQNYQKFEKVQLPNRNQQEDKDGETIPTSNTYRQSSQNLIQRQSTEEEQHQYNDNQDRIIKRSVSAHFNILQQKKIAILNDIEDLNKLIEQENDIETHAQQQNQNNENLYQLQHDQIHHQYKKNQKSLNQIQSRKNSKHQNQSRTRNNSTMQELQRPTLQGFAQTHSYTELADKKNQISDHNLNYSPSKSSAPSIPFLKLSEHEGSDKKNNNTEKKDRLLQQIQQTYYQQSLNREPKRVNSQHVLHNKDPTLIHERLGYNGMKKRDVVQKENNQHSATKNTKPLKTRQVSPEKHENTYQDQNNGQINIYHSLSPEREQSNGGTSTNFIERNKKWLEIKKNRMEEIQNNQSNKEMKECTFKPQTNKQIIKYNPYVHKEQLKQSKSNIVLTTNKISKNSHHVEAHQKMAQNDQINIENIPMRTQSTSQSRKKKESDDLGIGKIFINNFCLKTFQQGLQSPIMQRFSEVEFWSQSDASVFKAMNDIDTSYQNELKKEINDVLDIIQGFQIGISDKQSTKKSQSLKKLSNQKDINDNKQIIPQKLKKH